MRILNVSALYPPEVIGGAEIGVHNVASELARLGHDLHAVTLARNECDSIEADYDRDGVQVTRVPLSNLYWPYDAATKPSGQLRKLAWHAVDTHNPAMVRRVANIVRERAPDVVLTNNLQGFSTAVVPGIVSMGIPVVHVVHDFSLLCVRTALYRGGNRCGERAARCTDCKVLTRPRSQAQQPWPGLSAGEVYNDSGTLKIV